MESFPMIRIGVFTGSGRKSDSEPVIIKATTPGQPQRNTVHINVEKDESSSETGCEENQS